MAKIVWRDLDERLVTDSQGNLKTAENVEAVATSIDNILGTMQGERVMIPQFASRFRSLLFESLTEDLMNYVANEIRQTVEYWDDRVTVVSVSLYVEPDQNYMDISLEFRVRSFQNIFTYEKRFSQEGVE